MKSTGFGSAAALRLSGITYRQLDYWTRTGLVGSSLRAAAGRGSRRAYSYEDLVALRLVSRLLGAGVSLQAIRRAVKYLKAHARRPLATLGLLAKGKAIYAMTDDPARLIEATAGGQVVIAIALGPLAQELDADVRALRACRNIAVRHGGSTYEAQLTPDLEAGGFTIEVTGLPGCITEADSLREARSTARDAIRTWLGAQTQSTKPRARAS